MARLRPLGRELMRAEQLPPPRPPAPKPPHPPSSCANVTRSRLAVCKNEKNEGSEKTASRHWPPGHFVATANQYHIKIHCKVRAQQNRATAARGTTALRRWTSGLVWSGVPTGPTPDQTSPEVHSGRQACTGVTAVHVSWAQDWQAARDAQRSPSLAQPPPRCSRSAPPTLLIAPAEPDPEGLPGAGQLQSGSETAARTCLRAACGLPAAPGCLLPEPLLCCRRCLSAWALLQRPHPCSGPVQSGGSRGCSGVLEVLCWRWVGAETCLVVKV